MDEDGESGHKNLAETDTTMCEDEELGIKNLAERVITNDGLGNQNLAESDTTLYEDDESGSKNITERGTTQTEQLMSDESISILKSGSQSLQHSKGVQEKNSADSFSVLEPVNLGSMSFDNNLPIISVPDDFFDADIQFNGNRCSQLFSSIATENTLEDIAAVKNDVIIEVIDNHIISAVDKDMIMLESVNDSIILELEPISHSTPTKNMPTDLNAAETGILTSLPVNEMSSEHGSVQTYGTPDKNNELANPSISVQVMIHNQASVSNGNNSKELPQPQVSTKITRNRKNGRKQNFPQNTINFDNIEVYDPEPNPNTAIPKNRKRKTPAKKLPKSSRKDAVEVVDSPQKTITNASNDGSQKGNSLNIRVHDQDCIPALSSTDNSTINNSKSLAAVSKGRKCKGRKRKFPDQTKEIKKARINKNEDYMNCKGVLVKKKIFSGYDFDCKCPKKCTEKVSSEIREQEFKIFWGCGSYDSRCLIIQNKVEEKEKKRSYSTKNSKRVFTRIYKIGDITVCKKTFLNTYQISQSRINVALSKKKKCITKDSRGSAGGQNKVSTEKRQEVVEFINKFPRYKSHYCRDQSESKYLAPHLNLSILYDKYSEIYNNPVSKSTFKQIFYNDFNLRFKKPHKDTCLRCDQYSANKQGASGRQLEELEAAHKTHLDHATSLRNQMNTDLKSAKSNPEIETLTFDLQKTHCLPCIPTGIAYYKRQLNLYNLGIHCGSTDCGYFHIWLEHEAGRGTQEVGSCLRKFILEELKPTAKHLFLWADSCGGQNRSIKMVVMLLHILQNHSMLETITLRFLQPGHTFLPNDSEFGDVECALKFNERLYTDLDYIRVMQSCRRKRKFVVKRMEKKDFLSVDPLLKAITNRKFDIDKRKISWLSTFEIRLVKEFPKNIYLKSNLNDLSSIVDISKHTKRAEITAFKDIHLPVLWPEGKALSAAKIQDLHELLKSVPSDCHEFYTFLSNVKSSDFIDDVEGFGSAIDFNVEEE